MECHIIWYIGITFKRNLLIPASVWMIIYPDDEGSHIPEDRSNFQFCLYLNIVYLS